MAALNSILNSEKGQTARIKLNILSDFYNNFVISDVSYALIRFDSSKIRSASPSGMFLRDDGTWASAGPDLSSLITVKNSPSNIYVGTMLPNNIQSACTIVGADGANGNTSDINTGVGFKVFQNNSGYANIGMGYYAAVQNSGSNGVFMGNSAGYNNSGNYVIGVGTETTLGNTGSSVFSFGYRSAFFNSGSNLFTIGNNAAEYNTLSNLMIWGASSTGGGVGYLDVYIGSGLNRTNQTIHYVNLRQGTAKAGELNKDMSAAPFNIVGAVGTGNGLGGSIKFKVAPAGVSGTNQNNLVDALTIEQDGKIGIGITPTANLHLKTSNSLAANFGLKVHDTSDNVLFDIENNGDWYRDNQRFMSSVASNMTYLRIGYNVLNNFTPAIGALSGGDVGIGMDIMNSAVTLGGSVGVGSGIFNASGYRGGRNIGFGTGIGSSITTGTQNLMFGYNTGNGITTGSFNIHVAHEFVTGNYSNTLAFGHNGTVTGDNQIIFGGLRQYMSVKFGTDSDSSGFGSASFIHTIASVSAGITDIDGWDYELQQSKGTGTGKGGRFIIKVAPAGPTGNTQNTYITTALFDQNGRIGFGNTNPTAKLDIETTGTLAQLRIRPNSTAELHSDGDVIYNGMEHKALIGASTKTILTAELVNGSFPAVHTGKALKVVVDGITYNLAIQS